MAFYNELTAVTVQLECTYFRNLKRAILSLILLIKQLRFDRHRPSTVGRLSLKDFFIFYRKQKKKKKSLGRTINKKHIFTGVK